MPSRAHDGAPVSKWAHDTRAVCARRLGSRVTPSWTASGSARRGALRCGVERVQRLAAAHEQPVALGPAERDVGAHLGQPDASEELAFGRPHGHAAVTETAPAGVAVARHPDVAVDVAARAVGAALDT